MTVILRGITRGINRLFVVEGIRLFHCCSILISKEIRINRTRVTKSGFFFEKSLLRESCVGIIKLDDN